MRDHIRLLALMTLGFGPRHFVSSRRIFDCHLCYVFRRSPLVDYVRNLFLFLSFRESGGISLLVYNLPRRGEISFEGIFLSFFSYYVIGGEYYDNHD